MRFHSRSCTFATNVFIAVPEKATILTISGVTENSVTIEWSTGNTVKIDQILVIYYDNDTQSSANQTSVSIGASPTAVSSLNAGHMYCFSIKVTSNNLTSTSLGVCQRTSKNNSKQVFQLNYCPVFHCIDMLYICSILLFNVFNLQNVVWYTADFCHVNC